MVVMWTRYHPRIPWLFWDYCALDGGPVRAGEPYQYVVHDQRTGQTIQCPTEDCVHQFAADHSSNGRGLGDYVHRAAQAVGAERCAPCARRQAILNSLWSPFD